MSVTLHAVLPPAGKESGLEELKSVLVPDGHAALVGADGRRIELPAEVYAVLREAVTAMAQGQAVSVTPTDTMLTTQAAADLLSVSRPTLVRLLESGDIPYLQPGRHRRVALVDLQAYQQRIRHERRQVLGRMSREAVELNGFEDADSFVETR